MSLFDKKETTYWLEARSKDPGLNQCKAVKAYFKGSRRPYPRPSKERSKGTGKSTGRDKEKRNAVDSRGRFNRG
jgi:hypothetical protein